VRRKPTIFYMPEMLPLMIDINSGHYRGSSHLRVPGSDVLLELRFALRSPREFLSYSRPAFHDYLMRFFFNDRKVGGWLLDVQQNGSSLFLVMYFDFVLVRELCC
jgi:hypothetical protein